MIRFVPWSEVGTITVSPGDNVVEVGAFELAEGADTLWVRMTNTGTPGPWPWSYGILSFKTDEGQPLGSLKAYNSFDGEVFRLGVGLPPSVRAGVLTFEPRGFNMAWIKQGNPWTLKFEAQGGSSGGQVTSYWNRDPVNGVLSPVTNGDDVDLGPGSLTANSGSFGEGRITLNNSGSGVFYRQTTTPNIGILLGQSDIGGAQTAHFLVTSDGVVKATNTTLQPISSERRLKENITLVDADVAWETIKSVPYYAYNFIGSTVTSYGPMADEVPLEMKMPTSRVDEVGVIHTFDNGMLQARLYAALQAALLRIEALESAAKP